MDEENKNEIEQPVEEIKEEVVQEPVEEIKEEPVAAEEPVVTEEPAAEEPVSAKPNGGFGNFIAQKWKLLAAIAGAIVVIIVAIVFVSGGKTRAIKKYVNGWAKMNAKKIINSYDFVGSEAFEAVVEEKFSNFEEFVKKFDKDDYKDFKDAYKEVDKDEVKEEVNEIKENLEELFDEMKDEIKSIKIKIKDIKSCKKLAGGLYAIKAKIDVQIKPKDKDSDDYDKADTYEFVVYKNKVIYSNFSLFSILYYL